MVKTFPWILVFLSFEVLAKPNDEALQQIDCLNKWETTGYQKSFQVLLHWMKQYPLKTNK